MTVLRRVIDYSVRLNRYAPNIDFRPAIVITPNEMAELESDPLIKIYNRGSRIRKIRGIFIYVEPEDAQ